MRLAALATLDASPWNARRHRASRADEARSSYEIDRDRIIHSSSFRELQYKTQVQGLIHAHWPRRFRTRLNHVLEVSQIARGAARAVGANEALAEAIALAHDLGHPPFGHAGERALNEAMQTHGGGGWNANVHSLEVVDAIEAEFIDFRGLDLTWATREGIARHSTPFDEPESFGEFASTPNGGLECQLVDLADVFAYLSHDLDDALAAGYLNLSDVEDTSAILKDLVAAAATRWRDRPRDVWPDDEEDTLIRAWLRAVLVHRLIEDAVTTASRAADTVQVSAPEEVRACEARIAQPSSEYDQVIRALLSLLLDRYYRSSDVSASDQEARKLMLGLFEMLLARPELTPERFSTQGDRPVTVARYLASLNDHTAVVLAEKLGVISAGSPEVAGIRPTG